jgi:hypothetical protein
VSGAALRRLLTGHSQVRPYPLGGLRHQLVVMHAGLTGMWPVSLRKGEYYLVETMIKKIDLENLLLVNISTLG